ncbi:MAG: carboxypeptidase-like regulatory domain-containing protein [Spirochaetes bacterium]|nr:carboxypeptidase-like regulatory domain-containing protein [Spirochaetota bacterium]
MSITETVCRKPGTLPILVLVFAGLAYPASAQSGRSWMSGIVLGDSDSHGLPGAIVELDGDQANPRLASVRLVAETDGIGSFKFAVVPYGYYSFQVSFEGFATYRIEIYLPSDTPSVINVKLRRGAD